MGSGNYSSTRRNIRFKIMAEETGVDIRTASTNEIFTAKEINSKMSPVGVDVRESRDSAEHPKSYPIVLALDVTGSMGTIPTYLIKEGLPKIMQKIIDAGIKDPQLLFLGIGDAAYDDAPLQVGQFESSDDLLDYWLQNIYLEGGGGGNSGEDYLLAHHFVQNHTITDSFEKRGEKGILITIGDERYVPLTSSNLKKVYQDPTESPKSTALIETTKAKWDVFHIHTNNRSTQAGVNIAEEWGELLGKENVIVENNRNLLADTIVNLILKSHDKNVKPILGNISGNVITPTKML